MSDDAERSKIETAEQPTEAKRPWETPVIEVLPLTLTLNSVSGPSDGPYSQLS